MRVFGLKFGFKWLKVLNKFNWLKVFKIEVWKVWNFEF